MEDQSQKPEQPEQTWSTNVREAVREFVASIGESSRQLASAAERFAGASLPTIDDFAARARESARTSSEMAAAAGEAAAEARRIARSIQDAVREAGEHAKTEARQAVEDVVGTIGQSAEEVRSEIERRVEEAVRQIDSAASHYQESAAVARYAAAEARQAAAEAKAQAERSQQSPSGDAAQPILERLEADYKLLTRLVQELHTGISARPAPSAPAPAEPEAQAEQLWQVYSSDEEPHETASQVQEPKAEQLWHPTLAYEGWHEAAPAYEAPHETAPIDEEPSAPEPASPLSWPMSSPIVPAWQPEARHAEESMALTGRVMVKVAPVPDFDRLLSLDGALGRLGGVINVTLADYAKEEVTFRIELESTLSVEGFTQALSSAAGQRIEITSADRENVSLRLVA